MKVTSLRIVVFELCLVLVLLLSSCQASRLPHRLRSGSSGDHGNKGNGVIEEAIIFINKWSSMAQPLVMPSSSSKRKSRKLSSTTSSSHSTIATSTSSSTTTATVSSKSDNLPVRQQESSNHHKRVQISSNVFNPTAEKVKYSVGGGVGVGVVPPGNKYQDVMDMTEMDYSPAKRKPPIHN